MSFQMHDRYVWLGLGVCLFLTAKAIRHAMTDIVQLTEIDPDQYESQRRPASLEDKIPLDMIRTLVSSPNPCIANAATSIAVSCFAHLPNAYELLNKDAFSSDPQTRTAARQAISFLRDWPAGLDLGGPRSPLRSPPSPRSVGEIRSVSTPSPDPDIMAELFDAHQSLNAPGFLDIPSVANPIAGWTSIPRERPVVGDQREVEERRRRREAMVLHVGDGGVEEGDIIRPREG